MTTNTKAIITANQKAILREFKGQGGATNFVKTVDYVRQAYAGRYGPLTPYKAIYEMYHSLGYGLIYNGPIRQYLHSIGLTDDRRLDRDGGNDLFHIYASLMARDGAKLYDEIKSKGVKAAKKKMTKRTQSKTNEFGLARL